MLSSTIAQASSAHLVSGSHSRLLAIKSEHLTQNKVVPRDPQLDQLSFHTGLKWSAPCHWFQSCFMSLCHSWSRVAVLDGGYPAWKSAGYDIDQQPVDKETVSAAATAASSPTTSQYKPTKQVAPHFCCSLRHRSRFKMVARTFPATISLHIKSTISSQPRHCKSYQIWAANYTLVIPIKTYTIMTADSKDGPRHGKPQIVNVSNCNWKIWICPWIWW